MTEEETIIISNYRTRVNFYGLFTVRAWVLVAGLAAIGFIAGAWVL